MVFEVSEHRMIYDWVSGEARPEWDCESFAFCNVDFRLDAAKSALYDPQFLVSFLRCGFRASRIVSVT